MAYHGMHSQPSDENVNEVLNQSELERFYWKIHYLTRKFYVKFHAKNRYRTNREVMSAISVFQVKFHVEVTSQVMDFP